MITPLSDEELASLAVDADARNRTLGIDGVLFVAGECFLQILEGKRTPVRWLYKQIEQDPRHRRMVKLMDAPIERRAFGRWSMRLLSELDLSRESSEGLLEAIRSAGFLDTDETPAPTDLGGLVACPAILAREVFGRDVPGAVRDAAG